MCTKLLKDQQMGGTKNQWASLDNSPPGIFKYSMYLFSRAKREFWVLMNTVLLSDACSFS
jgi:hypothetical protein